MNKKQKGIILLLCTFFALVCVMVFSDNDVIKKRYSNYKVFKELGLVGFLVDDITTTVSDLLPKDLNKEIEKVEAFKANREIIKPFETETKNSKKKIILIQLEGIDAITMDMKINGSYIMENLNRLRAKSVYYPNTYDQTGSGRTSDGEFLALTSLLPIENESMYTHYSLDRVESLPKILRKQGFQTISLHGYEGRFWNRQVSHASLGYDTSYFMENFQEAPEQAYTGWGLSDEFILEKAWELVSDQEKNVFLHTILLTNHHPFNSLPVDYEDKIFSDPQNIVENYINSVHYTDYAIGKFIDNLENSGIMQESIVVVFSDHDSGITSDIYSYLSKTYSVDDIECDKIPFIFYCGNLSYEDNSVMGQSDIMPVILSYMDISVPETIIGENFFEGQKIVYLQGKTILNDKTIMQNKFNMTEITKTIVKYMGKEQQ